MELSRLGKIKAAVSEFIAHPITGIRAGLKSLFGSGFAVGVVALAAYSALQSYISTVVSVWVAMMFGITVINTAKSTVAIRADAESTPIDAVESSINLAMYAKDLGVVVAYKTGPILFSTSKSIGEECVFEPMAQAAETAVWGLYNGTRCLASRLTRS